MSKPYRLLDWARVNQRCRRAGWRRSRGCFRWRNRRRPQPGRASLWSNSRVRTPRHRRQFGCRPASKGRNPHPRRPQMRAPTRAVVADRSVAPLLAKFEIRSDQIPKYRAIPQRPKCSFGRAPCRGGAHGAREANGLPELSIWRSDPPGAIPIKRRRSARQGAGTSGRLSQSVHHLEQKLAPMLPPKTTRNHSTSRPLTPWRAGKQACLTLS